MTEDHDDYVLRWPRQLFKDEVAGLLNKRTRINGWSDACELLLEDAFVDETPRDAFTAAERASALTRGRQDPFQGPRGSTRARSSWWLYYAEPTGCVRWGPGPPTTPNGAPARPAAP